jgi:hypothetical protein
MNAARINTNFYGGTEENERQLRYESRCFWKVSDPIKFGFTIEICGKFSPFQIILSARGNKVGLADSRFYSTPTPARC